MVYAKSVDLKEEKEIPSQPSLVDITSHAVLLQHAGPHDLKHGIVVLPEGAALIGAGPITSNEFALPIHGTYIAGRFLDDEDISALGARTHLKVALFPWVEDGLPSDVMSAKTLLEAGELRVASVQGADLLAGYSVIRDVDGRPALIVRVEEPRDILQQGRRTTVLFMGILTAVGLITLIILVIVINRTVLKPLAALNAHVVRIRDSKDLTAHVNVQSHDELGTLAIAFNDTTDSLRQAQTELEAAHRSLLERAREAGMADVASGILHNVGNVLNSVNIATTTIKRQVCESRVQNLVNAAELIKQHSDDLGQFLTHDERGSKLPAYLSGLAQHFKEEQDSLALRLAELEHHVQHIAEIIALQQSAAKSIGLAEQTDLAELVKNAVKINAVALERHGIRVESEFEPIPPVLVDRHQVLQILVNLISNAKHALRDSGHTPKRIALHIEPAGAGRVRVIVSDNGVGIAPENLDRIFAYGFTTRQDGHGFGLHTAALAAKQLGGSLFVHSEGSGKGATFTLELAIQGAEE